ncbi:sodium- and chloride-dependent glycine transporter 1-like [Amphiura filiformis]|uniref:sodium- and chloride-dependent glycine transporter 1-like n=1 Tax=Amphiura filiformis TaxID=82378 RepID=UPI003B2228D9
MEKQNGKPNGVAKQNGSATKEVDFVGVSAPNVNRDQWDNKMDFVLSTIGFAVGLGNVWRFPYLCYQNGGGAFLVPYIIMLIVAGLPLFYLELALGQFASQGTITVWKISPIFTGVGLGMVIISSLVAIYYIVIIAWCIFYMYQSCQRDLPWVGCDHEWNTPNCYDSTDNTSIRTNDSVRASEEYWFRYVHQITDDVGDLGEVRLELLYCLAAIWFIVFLCLIKGVKSSGKVVYFTAIFPYAVLIILLIRGATLPGALEGIRFYIIPDVNELASPGPWKDASIQIFYSLGVSFGGLLTMSSYNKFHNNCYRDSLLVAFTNCSTSIFAGFAIFCTLGFMAQDSGVPIADVVDSGSGLAFVVYPEALSRIPVPQLWSFLFFFMLLTLGMDSEFAMMETVITAIMDVLPPHRQRLKPLITFGLCLIFFCLSIPCVTQGGFYVLTLMDWYAAGFSLFVIGILCCVIISYVYGIQRFNQDIESMLGYRPLLQPYWNFCWGFLTPIALGVIIFFSFYYYSKAYIGEYIYPDWAEALGWMLTLISFIVVPLYAIYGVFTQFDGPFEKRIRIMLKPAWDWGPLLDENRITAGYKPYDTEMTQLTSHDYAEPAHAVNGDAPPEYDGQIDHVSVQAEGDTLPEYNGGQNDHGQSDYVYSQDVVP